MEHSLPVEPQWVVNDRDFETGLMELYREIQLPEKMPTAFVCNCDYIASILIKTLKEHNLRVPEDVSVVGFDNYLYPWLCDIGITTYEVNIGEMARKAVETLCDRLEGVTNEPRVCSVEGRLIEKESVKRIKKIG